VSAFQKKALGRKELPLVSLHLGFIEKYLENSTTTLILSKFPVVMSGPWYSIVARCRILGSFIKFLIFSGPNPD
jgi:hypothetical protein